jgi:hypothetical protein
VILLVRAYQDTSEVLWRQSLIQALLSAQAPDGFDAISRSFRTYRETAEPWLEAERTKEEADLRQHVQDFARYLVEVKPLDQTKVQRQVPKVFGQ